jgi:hypothetical protein
MYGQTARGSLFRVLKEAPEMAGVPSKIRDRTCRKLADRLIAELWMLGYAVSARQPNDHEPLKGGRDPEVHHAWRNSKLKPQPKATQSDVEDGAEKAS